MTLNYIIHIKYDFVQNKEKVVNIFLRRKNMSKKNQPKPDDVRAHVVSAQDLTGAEPVIHPDDPYLAKHLTKQMQKEKPNRFP